MAASAPDSGVKPFQNAMKMAKTAIQLDAGNQHEEAYCEYLRSINYISHALLGDAVSKKDREMTEVEVEKMFRLAEQCLERAKAFIGRKCKSQDIPAPSSCPTVKSETSTDQSTGPSITPVANAVPSAIVNDSPSKPASTSKRGHRRVLSDGGGNPCPFLPPDVFQRVQTVESQDSRRKELTPIEEASRLNQKLKASYEARMARLLPAQAYQKTSLTLSLQRQMMENLIIAKARQDALHRKMEERRLRLQEEANRRFASSGTETSEDQQQRVLYTNVLEYEQDHDWPKHWKANLRENPDDITLVSGLVSYLLSCEDHPVVKLLRTHQYRVYNQLYPIVSKGLGPTSPALRLRPSRSAHSLFLPDSHKTPPRRVFPVIGQSLGSSPSLSPCRDPDPIEQEERVQSFDWERDNSFEDLEHFLTQLDWVPPSHGVELAAMDSTDVTFEPLLRDEDVKAQEAQALREHLKAIVKDIHIAIDQLLSLCLLSFECLNTATSKDLCVTSIEEAFFMPLWSPLLVLFRRVHRGRELAFECSTQRYHDASPGDLGVPPTLFPKDPSTTPGSYPYESAVQELKLLCQDCCPQRKLECIVRTLRLICACAEGYRSLQEADALHRTDAIGADDLLPILSYVALRSECPQLVSECAALEEFIHEGYLIGEEGYCLTSMQSALAYIESLHLRTAKLTSPWTEK